MPPAGNWRGEFDFDTVRVPFLFAITYPDSIPLLTITNGEEEITSVQVILRNDSMLAELPVFDSWLEASLSEGSMEGAWTSKNRDLNRFIPFTAERSDSARFPMELGPGFNVTGKWETGFYNPLDTAFHVSKALAIFEQSGSYVTGTFLTPTGDYRYLEGITDGRDLFLSSFDGANAYYFHGRFNNNRLEGDFWSSPDHHRNWLAERNDDLDPLQYSSKVEVLKDTPFTFSFPDLEGNPVSISDTAYKNKVVIIQVMGSWCPNCMDETAYLTELYEEYKDRGLEIIALAFERSGDFQKDVHAVRKLKAHFGSDYKFLIAGKATKEDASAKLPFLNAIEAFPTTIFVDRKGKIAKVHSGFSGPATGYYNRNFKKETEALVEKLLK